MPLESYQVPSAAETGADSLRTRNSLTGLPEGAVIRRPLDAGLIFLARPAQKTQPRGTPACYAGRGRGRRQASSNRW
jgi:hypothetical protein